MNINYYRELLNSFRFNELEQLLTEMPSFEMQDILYELAYDQVTEDVNMLVYTFCQTLLHRKESASLHLSLSNLMGMFLNHVHNAESVGLYHGLRAGELEPENIDILEFLLYYNHIPEKLLADDIAVAFARKFISQRPDSLAAQITLSKERIN